MNKKRALFATIICGLIVGILIIINTYSLWQVTHKLDDENVIISACINIEFENQSNGIEDLTAYPISDVEGASGDSYNFKVINKCSEEVNYIIALESLEIDGVTNYMPYTNIKLMLDNNRITLYSDLKDIESVKNEEDDYNIRDTKRVSSGTVAANSYNEHEIRIWLDKDTTLVDATKPFKSKIRITGGQDIKATDEPVTFTPEECFNVTEFGVLTSYDVVNCGLEVVIPPKVNGVVVKTLGSRFLTKKATDEGMASQNVPKPTSLDISYMYGLEKIADNAAVDYVGTDAELIIPNSVKEIGVSAFNKFNGKYLRLSNSLTKIGDWAFKSYVGSDQELVVPDSVTTLTGYGTFNSFNGKSLKLSKNLKYYPNTTFANYNGDELIIPEGAIELGTAAFARFNGKKLQFPSTLRTIGVNTFDAYEGQNQTLELPDGLVTLSSYSFKSYIGNEFEIPASVTNLNNLDFGFKVFYFYQGNVIVHNQYLKDNQNILVNTSKATVTFVP